MSMKIELAFLGIFIFFSVVLVFIYVDLKRDGVECLSDPLVYGVKTSEEYIDAPIGCACTVYKDGYLPFSVNSTARIPVKVRAHENYDNLNYTAFKESLKLD